MAFKLEDFEVLTGASVCDHSEVVTKSSPWLRVIRKCDGQHFMWKELTYDWLTLKEKQQLISEIQHIQHLKQNYLLPCFECIDNIGTSTLYIITEWCENGDMQSLLNMCRGSNTFLHGNFIWKILYQLLKALENIHSQNNPEVALYHYIAPKNIFFDSQWNIKFGLLDIILDRYFCFQKTICDTPYLISPEQISKKLSIEKSHIWSIGCLIYELCALEPPFAGANWSQLLTAINYETIRRIPHVYSNELQSMICEMLIVNEEHRPSVSTLLARQIFYPFKTRSKKAKEAATWDVNIQQKLKGVHQKEKTLSVRERNLNERQIEIEESERKLSLKMKHLQEQLDRAEKIIGNLNINKEYSSAPELTEAATNIMKIPEAPPPLPAKEKKKVHFKLDMTGKENTTQIAPAADFEKKRQDLEWRLQRAQNRAMEKRSEELQSRQLDKTVHLR